MNSNVEQNMSVNMAQKNLNSGGNDVSYQKNNSNNFGYEDFNGLNINNKGQGSNGGINPLDIIC